MDIDPRLRKVIGIDRNLPQLKIVIQKEIEREGLKQLKTRGDGGSLTNLKGATVKSQLKEVEGYV